ncbi:MAG: histidine--tRNA ligase, partial [Bryobacterales bacterium]|nr:histidine--tRNA ligase [Bryobacterales bacterium]
KGMRDILPPSSAVWNRVERIARGVFARFHYQEIRTPILEQTLLFARGVGEETDIVSKEMYTFEDRDGASLTLRPEITASVMRAYIEHRLDQVPGVKKLFYSGQVFRRERPQKGRYRQFYQIGGEAIGSESPILDAEVIELSAELLSRSGIGGFHLLLNSVGDPKCRPGYVDLLRERLAEVAPRMCGDCQRRSVTNPLRVLDCKVAEDQPIIETLPSILDHLCAECSEHFGHVRAYLDSRGISYEVRPRLVRGLDYYTRTTFEFTHSALGSQNTILAGGRYDGLAESIGSKVPAPGVGFSLGQDRLVMALEETCPDRFQPAVDVFLAPLGGNAEQHAVGLAAELRSHGISIERSVDKKLKRALEVANKIGARFALIVGDDELAKGTYQLKDMKAGDAKQLSREELAEHIKPKHGTSTS